MIERWKEQKPHSVMGVVSIEEPLTTLQFGDDSVNKKPESVYFDLFQSFRTKSLGRGYFFEMSETYKYAGKSISNEQAIANIRAKISRIISYYDENGEDVFICIYVCKKDISSKRRLRATRRVIHVVDRNMNSFGLNHMFIFEPLGMALKGI